MMYLTDKHEIAAAMNFCEYPVLSVNQENRPYADIDPDSRYAVGCRVRVAWDHKDPRYKGMTTHGELYMEDGRLEISGEGGMLSASFGYSEVMKMAAEANVPVVHRGEIVVVVLELPSVKTCMVRMMKISPRINIHCMTVCHLEDIEDEAEVAEIRNHLKRSSFNR